MARIMAIAGVLLAMAPAVAQDGGEKPELPPSLRRVTGEELQREVTGATLTGRHASGMQYSEFHSPDGRIYGHNNHVAVRDGCWVIREDEVCYSYEKGPAPGVFCWRFYRAQGGYTILLPTTGTIGTAKLEMGNPYAHNDGGEPWSCEALLSRRVPAGSPMMQASRRR